MNAKKFMKSFFEQIKELKPSGYGKKWTEELFKVLEQVGTKNKYVVNDKFVNGEVFQIDCSFYKPASQPNWNPPEVVIENENSYGYKDIEYDFWKLTLYSVPLRVMIAYGETEKQAKENGVKLINLYSKWKLRQIEKGETLLFMGWDQVSTSREWYIWKIKGNKTLPKYLGKLG